MAEKSREGEMFGVAQTPGFLKEKIDLAHARGFATLVVRVTSMDEPDENAVYNLYQLDEVKAKASAGVFDINEEGILQDYVIEQIQDKETAAKAQLMAFKQEVEFFLRLNAPLRTLEMFRDKYINPST